MATQSNSPIDGLDITNYWQYFNLDRDPFTMNIEETLTYIPIFWEKILDQAQHLLHYKNQLLIITGVNGVGKTVMQDLLAMQLSENAHVTKIPAEPNLDITRLIEFLSDAFLVPWQPENTIEQALDEQLEAFQYKDKNCILLIDNAQLLPNETLEALLYLIGQQSDNQMRFHAVLFGEPAVQQTFERMLEPSEKEFVHFLTLESFSPEETEEYLSHRLSASGWQGEFPMNQDIFTRIFRLSEGNPARINRIARRFLLDLLTDQENANQNTSWFRKHITRVIGGSLILLALIALGLWTQHTSIEKQLMPEKPAALEPAITINGQTMRAEPEAEIKPAEPKVEIKPVEPKVEVKPAEPKVEIKPVEPKLNTATPKTKAPAPAKIFTIQLLGLKTEEAANQFVKTNHLEHKARVVRHEVAGKKTLFLVLYGHYANQEEAKQAITSLPDNLKKTGPWARKAPSA